MAYKFRGLKYELSNIRNEIPKVGIIVDVNQTAGTCTINVQGNTLVLTGSGKKGDKVLVVGNEFFRVRR